MAELVDADFASPIPSYAPRASFRRLTLTDYRSYTSADIAFDGRPVTFVGANGAGKTNLLEALSLLGPGRGLRSAKLEDLACSTGRGGWAVASRLSLAGHEHALGVGGARAANGGERRQCRIDGASARGPTAFVDYVRFLWLTPAQDGLFAAGAGERRRFLDRLVQAHHASHARALSDYETAMRQRQRLLDEGRADDIWLSALETQMAQTGVALAAARREVAARLAAADVSALAAGVFPAADIALQGDLEVALGDRPVSDVEDEFSDYLKSHRRLDADTGRATRGPHRSDMIVSHRMKQMPARVCSTGEQKALLIGLVLANACALSADEGHGAPLVLLLDEIAAHLDPDRRAALFDILYSAGFQCFMTGTDKDLFAAWGDRAQSFEVADGGVRPIN